MPAAARGYRLAVEVGGRKVGFARATRTSSSTGPVAAGVQTRHPRPRITGTAKVGRTLTVRPGTWDPGTTLSFRWYVDDHAVRQGADGTLTVPAGTRGDRIKVRVVSTKPGYRTTSQGSPRTARVR